MKVIVASKNPVKIKAAQQGFTNMFPDTAWELAGISVPSGVSSQPMSQEETLHGAMQRANNAQQKMPEADFWVGIEGGVASSEDDMEVFAWIYILAADGRVGKSRTANFYLPAKVKELVSQGIELGKADDLIFDKDNSKQKGGSVGILTDGKLDRTAYYETAVLLALIPFLKPDLY